MGGARAVAAVALVAGAAAFAPAAQAAPRASVLVAFRSGKSVQRTVGTSAVAVKVGRRRCAVASATPLAALMRARPGAIALRDYGSCSRRGADGGGLFVRSIRSERNRGSRGWVYKVGRRLASAGAGDPSGPFGRGRLRSGARVTWFYGVLKGGSFQRTLELRLSALGGGAVRASVRAYDDFGRGVPARGATVSGGGRRAVTGADGVALMTFPAGRVGLRAAAPGLVPSFAERVTVR